MLTQWEKIYFLSCLFIETVTWKNIALPFLSLWTRHEIFRKLGKLSTGTKFSSKWEVRRKAFLWRMESYSSGSIARRWKRRTKIKLPYRQQFNYAISYLTVFWWHCTFYWLLKYGSKSVITEKWRCWVKIDRCHWWNCLESSLYKYRVILTSRYLRILWLLRLHISIPNVNLTYVRTQMSLFFSYARATHYALRNNRKWTYRPQLSVDSTFQDFYLLSSISFFTKWYKDTTM